MNWKINKLIEALKAEYGYSQEDVKDTMEDKIEANGYRRGLMYAISVLQEEL